MDKHLCKFRKRERLCSKTRIADLFAVGNTFVEYPFRVVWKEVQGKREYPVQLAISVAKRKIRKATKRNLLKRRIKEAYRQRKSRLYGYIEDVSIDVMIIYLSSEIKEYYTIDTAMNKIIERLKHEEDINKDNNITC